MVKVIRVTLIALALQGLVLTELLAQPAYCYVALQRCLNQCKVFPDFFREGCTIGCGIGYLNCGD